MPMPDFDETLVGVGLEHPKTRQSDRYWLRCSWPDDREKRQARAVGSALT